MSWQLKPVSDHAVANYHMHDSQARDDTNNATGAHVIEKFVDLWVDSEIK